MTIGGQVHADGLGTHAASSVEYYACGTVTRRWPWTTGTDAKGATTFETLAYGEKTAPTGTPTDTTAPQPPSAPT
ncbi:NPCBM/NEW2 domain-containing protein [Streptomyces sp. 130]|uniref:NPCBM/NEW2 domain-containing protein n=1 Tax=Streptomyces sp. 130 TaxID=2591006 RepID=UPI0021B095D8|nr:NPCBM/NEW2 domain-containing protein [Streptomyces sp. 130]